MLKNLPAKADGLIVHVATGGSVNSYAKKNGINRKTAYSWSRHPQFATRVRAFRAEITDQIVGGLTAIAVLALGEIRRVLESSEPTPLKLKAATTALERWVPVVQHADLVRQISDLKAELESLRREDAHAGA
jgi:hypothetical protein